ncbi:MAG: S41 family peptidase [Fimbriimonadales bacterium]|jgi:carboxyl-terminal processing protease|nr:S41 family peptidase [Fimbriimonadales bacterium]GBC90328.1 putative CtpA-like serine protease [bacterium HR14]GIV14148.1 MAG: peptidase S41 [Fimbriimonadales bacterium]CUU11139.1 C-terminal processing peptidase-3. Serine peptidase. MEROPS family S41A [Armatimonadetes bacterium GBS]CUU36567.1 C-terminal processing peptidase-3. Serine peptidase. MEROPS family S41A [Armatimonadetes bacterium GXS]
MRRGRALLQALLLLPALGLLFILGFVSADMWANPTGRPHEALALLRSRWNPIAPDSAAKIDPVEAFQSVLAEIENHYYGKPPAIDKLTYTSIDGMLSAVGDPYTRFMEPEAFKRMQEDTSGKFTGIGALLEDAPGGARVVRPLPNSPAEKAGLKAGDVIIAVDGKSLERISVDEAVRLIRGPRYSTVVLTVRREGEPAPLKITIRRDVIESPTVDVYLEDTENKIYRIWLQQFNEKAPDLVAKALRDIQKNGGRAVILDLRTNPGGLLDSAVKVASLFVPGRKTVVQIVGRQGLIDQLHSDSSLYLNLQMPIVVLMNGSSASASEIVAGALRDHKVAILIGEDSFGKGLVQTVIPTSQETAVAITTAKYLTPNGTDLNAKIVDGKRVGGLKPDIEVKADENWRITDEDRSKDKQLQKALEVLREKLNAPLAGTAAMRASADEMERR